MLIFLIFQNYRMFFCPWGMECAKMIRAVMLWHGSPSLSVDKIKDRKLAVSSRQHILKNILPVLILESLSN